MQCNFENLRSLITMHGNFDNSCELVLSDISAQSVGSGILTISIRQVGNQTSISNLKLTVSAVSGDIQFLVGGNDAEVVLQYGTSGEYDFRLWRNSRILIGEETTSNGVRIVCFNSEFITGRDCMLSDGILIQSTHQHGLVDLISGEIINNKKRVVRLGDHVWLGRACTLMPDIYVGNGSVIGTGTIVTKDIPPMSIAVGVPAQVVKSSTTWSRSPTHLDEMSKKYVDQNH